MCDSPVLLVLCVAISPPGPTPMLEERQMKLQDPFPSHGTAAAAAGAAAAAAAAGKASSRQLDGQLNGSSCLGQDPSLAKALTSLPL